MQNRSEEFKRVAKHPGFPGGPDGADCGVWQTIRERKSRTANVKASSRTKRLIASAKLEIRGALRSSRAPEGGCMRCTDLQTAF